MTWPEIHPSIESDTVKANVLNEHLKSAIAKAENERRAARWRGGLSILSATGLGGWFGRLALIFTAMKVGGIGAPVSWPWWKVLAPAWAPWVIIGAALVAVFVAWWAWEIWRRALPALRQALAARRAVLDVVERQRKKRHRHGA